MKEESPGKAMSVVLETEVAVRAGEPGANSGKPKACVHGVCEEGKGLDPACSACASQVCAVEPSCCAETWGEGCVQYAAWFCGICGGGSCEDLPAGGLCISGFAVYCEGGGIEWKECWEDDARCGWDEALGRIGCLSR